MNRAGRWFGLLAAAQILFLLTWAGYHEYVRQHAPVLLLKGRPVDPQDLLRGDYLTLHYDISTVTPAAELPDAPPGDGRGQDVWVLLEQRDRYHVVAQVAREQLRPQPGQVLVRGTWAHDWRDGARADRVRYGIEKYFVPEGRGNPRFQQLEVEVSVSPAHRLYIRRVLLDGRAFP